MGLRPPRHCTFMCSSKSSAQAYEVLELFVELLAVRVHLIEKSKERPQDMNEALGTLVYAAARIQVPRHACRAPK